MIKKVQITEKRCKDRIAEYVLDLDDDATNEEYCNLAWECAIDEFVVDPEHKLNYKFTITDYTQ